MQNIPVSTVRRRLITFKGRYPSICERSGLGYSWLSKFARGTRGKRPSYETINRLIATLDELDAKG